MKYSAYTKYKKSGVEWLDGDGSAGSPQGVPEHWDVKQARRCLVEHKQGYYTTDAYVDDGFKLLRITDLDGNGFVKTDDCPSVDIKDDATPFILRDNDFVFARTGGAGSFGLVRYLKEKTVFASYLIRFRFSKKTYADFLRYSFLSKQFVQGIIRNIHGGVNQNVHAEDIKDQFIPLPPLPEQQAIADFLDLETGRIDTLIGKKQKFVELLKEKRTALISRAVTKGLNPKVKMKPSGVEWLGDVPEHWKVISLRHLFNIKAGGDLKEEFYSEEKTEQHFYPIYTNSIKSNEVYGFSSKPFFKSNTITVTGRGEIGYATYRDHEYDAIIRLLVLTPTKKVPCKYYVYFINSMLNFFGGSTAVSQLSTEQISPYKVFTPPLPEQQAIAAFLDRETVKIDTLVVKVETAIEKLKEYRTALISAAVTGKIDVSTGLNTSVREVA